MNKIWDADKCSSYATFSHAVIAWTSGTYWKKAISRHSKDILHFVLLKSTGKDLRIITCGYKQQASSKTLHLVLRPNICVKNAVCAAPNRAMLSNCAFAQVRIHAVSFCEVKKSENCH